ncbi:MAG: HAD family hydrolase [Thermaerobacter sp.]|nr:HAD family hydrolase [Thermaerobacter sp.]
MNEPWPQAILLDMDDTILADGRAVDTCWSLVCDRLQARLAPVAPDAVVAAIRRQAAWYWSDPERHRRGRLDLPGARQWIVARAFDTLGIADDHGLAAQMAAEYGLERDRMIEPLPGALEALRKWRELGVKLALLTNGAAQPQRGKINRFGLAPLFDCIVIEGEFGVGKPDDRVYWHALSQLKVQPEKAWMIGDNLEWEVLAPQRLGIKGIWVDQRAVSCPPACEPQPYRIIRALSDLWADSGQPIPVAHTY